MSDTASQPIELTVRNDASEIVRSGVLVPGAFADGTHGAGQS